jgi:[ribosomal protein S5]-alanine N-acetyltransferase
VNTTRLVTLDDVPALTELVLANRDFLAPWEPVRGADYFTQDAQRALVTAGLERHRLHQSVPHVILSETGQVAGRVTLNDIVWGPFQSCHLGYWVSGDQNGRGLATAAVRHMVEVAFGELGLHRIQAGTLLYNTGSQRVLERNGFTRFGVAPQYLRIAGQWQDHALYQLIADLGG